MIRYNEHKMFDGADNSLNVTDCKTVRFSCTVNIIIFGIQIHKQSVLIPIRLIQKEQSDQGLHCLIILRDHF